MPPLILTSEWADRYRRLSAEASSERGQWDTSRAEYQRGILDTVDERGIKEVVFRASTQVGKTEILLNIIGKFIHIDPAPMICVMPTMDLAQDFVKDRIKPMIRDTPILKKIARVAEETNKDKNTLGNIRFPGGSLAMASGSNAKTLRSRPRRVGLSDEVDGYPVDVEGEGDPIALIRRRLQTFFNSIFYICSTPTIKGISRIDAEFENTDQRFYNVPCPHCSELQILEFSNLSWEVGKPETAYFKCTHCAGKIDNKQKNEAVKKGEWIATAPFNGRAGFHIWAAYSPWVKLPDIASEFLRVKNSPLDYKTFVNTILGESYDEVNDKLNGADLRSRAEIYKADLPARVLTMTCGVDVQPDRLELEVVGWGTGEESWSIDYHTIEGDPNIPQGDPGNVWDKLMEYLSLPWKHEKGCRMIIRTTFIDTGGSNTTAVYKFLRGKRGRRIYGIKGKDGADRAIVGAMQRAKFGTKRYGIDVWLVGVDSAKSVCYQRLREDTQGPGYCHFPKERGEEWYSQIVSESPRKKKNSKGKEVIYWYKADKVRNEAWDCRVYAYAAMIYQNPRWDRLAYALKKDTEKIKRVKENDLIEQPTIDSQDEKKPRKTTKKRKNFVNNW